MPAMRRPDETPPTAVQEAPRPSKTRRKAEMDELQALGEALIRVDPARLAELELPERLIEAIRETQRITRREARRRQMQFIGRLMREVDPAPVRARLAQWTDAPGREKARLHAIEGWRERLLVDVHALDALCFEYPDADRSAIAALVEQTHREQLRGSPPHAYRALFRALGALIARRD
jgi:ribosome-associated protein